MDDFLEEALATGIFNIIPVYQKKRLSLYAGAIVGYWPKDETSGTVALDKSGYGRDGVYSGVDLNNTLSRMGRPAPFFNGADYVNVFSPRLQAAFNPLEGGFFTDVKIPSFDNWIDGVVRHFCEFRADTQNRIYCRRASVDYKLEFNMIAGNVTAGAAVQVIPSLNWMRVGMVWSKSGNFFNGYVNGNLVYTAPLTGTWIGSLFSTNAVLGAANTSGTSSMLGWQSESILLNRAPTADEIIRDYTISSVERLSILGDSIPNDPSEWPYYLQDMNPNLIVLNHASPGHSIASNLAAQVLEAANDNADKTIIALGTNDYNAGNMSTLQSIYETAIQDLKTSNKNTVVSSLNLGYRCTSTNGLSEVPLGNLRTMIAAAAAAKGISCFNQYSPRVLEALNTKDGLHPDTYTGSFLLARFMANSLYGLNVSLYDIQNTPLVFTCVTTGAQTLTLYNVTVASGRSLIIEWGDGLTNTYTAGVGQRTHAYAGAGTYLVKFCTRSAITAFEFRDVKLSGIINAANPFPKSLTSMTLNGASGISVVVDSNNPIPSTVTIFYTYGNSVTWEVSLSAPVPPLLTVFVIDGASGFKWIASSSLPIPINLANIVLLSALAGNIVLPAAQWAGVNLLATVRLECNLAQAIVDDIINGIWSNKANYTAATPSLDLLGTGNAVPSGVYQAANPPTTAKEKVYDLVNGNYTPAGPEWTVTMA